MGSALYAAEILNHHQTLVKTSHVVPTSVRVDIAHPQPGNDIQIRRAFSRLHVYGGRAGSSGYTLIELHRASDSALVSWAGVNKDSPYAPEELLVDPSFFLLKSEDFLYAEMSAFGSPGESVTFNARTTVVFSRVAPQFLFIEWVSAGNFLIGLKDDGTIWKSTGPKADPLVWTQVYP